MLINADHRGWVAATVAATAVAAAAYRLSLPAYATYGGTWPGLAFGIAGTIAMVAAGLLAARKRFLLWRIGPARTWMAVHIWAGLLALPLIWFHSDFRLGGAFTTTLMVLFYVVIASGIFGLVVQQVVPSAMTARVPLETIHSQIEHVREGLAVDAYMLVAAATGEIPEAAEEHARLVAEAAAQQADASDWKQIVREPAAATPEPDTAPLRDFYLKEVRPYLRAAVRGSARSPDFAVLRLRAPDAWRERIERLRALCEESRQLVVQQRLHGWLHGWLFVHVPLSFALFVLVAIHIVSALRY
jgi:hypothetical protein